MKDNEKFVRVPIAFTDDNLAAIDQAAIAIRKARGKYIARSSILNKLIEKTDFARLVKEFSK